MLRWGRVCRSPGPSTGTFTRGCSSSSFCPVNTGSRGWQRALGVQKRTRFVTKSANQDIILMLVEPYRVPSCSRVFTEQLCWVRHDTGRNPNLSLNLSWVKQWQQPAIAAVTAAWLPRTHATLKPGLSIALALEAGLVQGVLQGWTAGIPGTWGAVRGQGAQVGEGAGFADHDPQTGRGWLQMCLVFSKANLLTSEGAVFCLLKASLFSGCHVIYEESDNDKSRFAHFSYHELGRFMCWHARPLSSVDLGMGTSLKDDFIHELLECRRIWPGTLLGLGWADVGQCFGLTVGG